LSTLEDFSAGVRALDRLTQPRPFNGRNLKGLNFFSRAEQTLLAALQRPGFNIAGLRRADLLPLLGQSSPPTLSRQLVRLRHLGVIKRVLGTYRYYLTRAGRAAIAAGRRLPSRPGDFHPEPLTDPDLTLSRHPARATERRLPPPVENWSSSCCQLAHSQRR